MDFHLEERRAWVRTGTHTVITDRDPRFARFAADPSGRLASLVRIWSHGSTGALHSYLGSICICRGGYRRRDLRRVFHRLTRRADRTLLKRTLRARSRATN